MQQYAMVKRVHSSMAPPLNRSAWFPVINHVAFNVTSVTSTNAIQQQCCEMTEDKHTIRVRRHGNLGRVACVREGAEERSSHRLACCPQVDVDHVGRGRWILLISASRTFYTCACGVQLSHSRVTSRQGPSQPACEGDVE